MTRLLAALLFVPFFSVVAAAQSAAPVGNATTGAGAFMGNSGGAFCGLCHGFGGGGGFGPDLAGGRGLTFSQFRHAVRHPWGVMPRFPRVSDETLADIYAYLLTTEPVDEPAAWRIEAPAADAPLGQHAATGQGCTQCHSGEMLHPRRDLGRVASDVDFEYFARIVYEHAPVQMGNWSRSRLPEAQLREIYDFIMLEGLLVPLTANVGPGEQDGDRVTYTLTVGNTGAPSKGLVAEDVTIALQLPAGSTVVEATGHGYEGVSHDAARGADVAVWKVPAVGPQDRQSYTVTLSNVESTAGIFRGSRIAWARPGNHRPDDLALIDDRIPSSGDHVDAPGQEFTLNTR
jgi:mono/diheme cytochrome c family protein